jgi:hypothetical protein
MFASELKSYGRNDWVGRNAAMRSALLAFVVECGCSATVRGASVRARICQRFG